MSAGYPAHAAALVQPALAREPDEVQLALNLFGAQCQLGYIDPSTLIAARTALNTTRDPGTLLTSWFVRIMDQVAQPPCQQLTFQNIGGLLDAALSNPRLIAVAGRQQDLYYLKGRLALIQGDANTALIDFNRSLDLQVRVSAALEQAALLGSSGFPQQGLAHLDHYEAQRDQSPQPAFGMPGIHEWVLQRQQYWPKELARLRATLRKDATHQAHGTE
jgi:hypothetical protein